MAQIDSGKLLNVVAKSWTDPAYKQRLMADPKSVLASEGIQVPDQANVKVIDQQPNDVHLILPPKPAGDINVTNAASHLSSGYMTLAHGTADMTFAHSGTADMTFASGSGNPPKAGGAGNS